MANPHLKLELRTREYLTEHEVEALVAASRLLIRERQ